MIIASVSEHVERAMADPTAGKSPTRHKSKLKVYDKNTAEVFNYEFDKMEIVKLDATPIEIALFSESTSPQGNHTLRILDYTCSRPGAVSIAYAFDTANNYVPDFTAGFCQRLGLHVALQKNEMVNIGVIVEVLDKQGKRTDLLLCDPQVGNGPGTKLAALSLLK